MYTISQLGAMFGLSRSTLLYYDSLGLLRPSARSEAGYRLYSDDDCTRMRQIVLFRGLGVPLSKIAALPQMKLGWMVARGPALERLELIADTYLSVSAPMQNALPRLLQAGAAVQQQIARRTASNLELLRHAVGDHSACQVLTVEGGWYATLRIPRTRTEEEWTLLLLDRDNVLVQPGFFYDFPSEAYLVLSLLTPPDVFREGLARFPW